MKPLRLLAILTMSLMIFTLAAPAASAVDELNPPVAPETGGDEFWQATPSPEPADTAVVVEFVELNEHELILNPKDTFILKPTLTPKNADVKTVTYSSGNEEVATVDERGKVTAVGVGVGTITVTSDSNPGATDVCLITVEPVALTKLSLSPAKLSLGLNASQPLTLKTTPADADASEVDFESADPEIASVDADGVVYGESAGTTTITARSGGVSAVCAVTVSAKPSFQLALGRSKTLRMTGAKNVVWRSDDIGVASVSGGKVTANGYGTAAVSAEDADTGKVQTWTVGVLNYVKKITVPSRNVTLYAAEQEYQILPSVTPSDATDLGYTYVSSNPDVASVSDTGLITAHAAGKARVTVTSLNGNRKAPISVTVSAEPRLFSMAREELTLNPGRKQTLKLNITAGVSKKGVVWTSSDPGVVSVSPGGRVVARAVGNAVISAEIPGLNNAYAETVVDVVVPVKQIRLSETALVMPVYSHNQLTALLGPEDATQTDVFWESSNPDVVSVDQDGNLTAKAPGSARITATAESGRRASCAVRVPRPAVRRVDRLTRR
jgi:uncharacterized protein YjdB